jgi:hypothetical protein
MSFRQLNVADPVHAEPVSRRDFLRLRVSRGRRILELSCERLFMRYHDACSEAARRQVSNHEDLRGVADSPTGFSMPPASALFAELERRLAEADELRVLESDWLGDGAFAREVGARVAAFRERGGLVTTDHGAGTEARAV